MQGEYGKGSKSGLDWPWIVLTVAFAGAMVLTPGHAAILTVINTNDSGAGSLRQAIADATDGDTITFDSALAGSTITLTSGGLVLDKDLSIDGDLNNDGMPDVTVSGNDSSRVFFVNSSAVASFEGLFITAGRAGHGGGIRNEGAVTLTNSTVSGNVALPSGFGTLVPSGGRGGGIYNTNGSLTLTNSIVSDNEALDYIGSFASPGFCGGICNINGSVTLTNSTVSDNSKEGIYNGGTVTLTNSTVSGNGRHGGIHNSGTMTLTNSTVSGNETIPPLLLSERRSGGILNTEDGLLKIVNTIIANSITDGVKGGDCENEGTLDTANSANNLIETGCVEIATLTEDPQLGPLQDNGGATETHELLLGSLAIDFIPRADCEVTEDQRGVPRPQGFGCDIGAFEREVSPIPPGPPAPVPAAGKRALGVLAVMLLSAMVWLDRRRRRHLK